MLQLKDFIKITTVMNSYHVITRRNILIITIMINDICTISVTRAKLNEKMAFPT